MKEEIVRLREEMRREGLWAYIVPGTDPHASEYMPAHWEEMQWLSGFNGESGTVVVTTDEALLWTDSRYYLQADSELAGSGIGLMRESDIDCPQVSEWLSAAAGGQQAVVGVNPAMWSVNAYKELRDRLGENGMTLKSVDLIDRIWTMGRPDIPAEPLYEYEYKYTGENADSKLSRIRKQMKDAGADAMIVSALDEIAWLLNIRGRDVEYNPVVISYVVLEQERCTLFVLPEKVTSDTAAYFKNIGVELRDYNEILAYLQGLHVSVLYDGARLNEALYEALPQDCRKINRQSPILVLKSRKNEVELDGERKAMRQDAVALTRFFKWLEEDAFREPQTEWTLMEKLHAFRLRGKHFVEESFGTIAGYKGNGAIVHYAATPQSCAEVKPEGMLLLDSGGQYFDGTTDITRTVWLGGDIPEQAKLDYTYVMKGHIALACSRFPLGTRGNQLDALAKQYMWQAGITYGHGTGHGVGHFLGCHEGPQNIRTDMNPTVLRPGNICSDEPGIYRTGEWGIRIENLVAVQEMPASPAATTGDRFLSWETLTLCYYDTTLLKRSIMTQDEIEWINAYHKHVAEEVCPLLNEDEAAWLKNKCQPI